MRSKLFFAFLFSLVLLTSLSSAEVCCFNPENGQCSSNSDEDSCTANGGETYNPASCSITQCDIGCCVLGTSTKFVTERECQLLSWSNGMQLSWQLSTKEECTQLAQTQESGACLYGTATPYECKYQTYNECGSGEFRPGVSCTSSELKTVCKSTGDTMCYEGNLYGKDDCGNADGLKQECSLDAGYTCERKNSKEAYCKSLNCDSVGKKNGDSWCVGPDGKGNLAEKAKESSSVTGKAIGITGLAEYGEGANRDNCNIGKLRDGNGKPIKCKNYEDAESCKPHCAAQGYTGCWSCVGDSQAYFYCYCGNKVEDSTSTTTTGTTPGTWARFTTTGWEQNISKRYSEIPPVGGIYYKQFCLNGEVKTERCADYRNEICSTGSGGEAKCEKNPAPDCIYAKDPEDCDPRYCDWLIFQDPTGNSKKLLEDLNLSACVPKYPMGNKISSGSKSSNDICTAGSFSAEITMEGVIDPVGDPNKKEHAQWALIGETGNYKNIGVFALNDSSLTTQADLADSTLSTGYHYYGTIVNDYVGIGNFVHRGVGTWDGKRHRYPWSDCGCWAGQIVESQKSSVPINAGVLDMLYERCRLIGDCDGKVNWAGTEGSNNLSKFVNLQTTGEIPCTVNGAGANPTVTCTFEFTCSAWKPPIGESDCEKCGTDGLDCTEYKCESLGKGCEWKEETGYCVKGSDHSAPTITLKSMNPASPIPPYTPVEITITTNENSICKFGINEAAAKFEEMEYGFGSTYSKEHTVILTLPGKRNLLENDTTSHPLLTKDGKYSMFVRCEDPAGNGDAGAPFLISFEVMQNPDGVPPILKNFNPVSGSRIEFNKTSKSIKFEINEPAECKWDFEDKRFNESKNNFVCDRALKNNPSAKYYCSGTIPNITLNLSEETKIYIKCSDQPWLEGKEDKFYRRNTQTSREGTKYSLMPSEQFFITSAAPSGEIKINPKNGSIELKVLTYGGANFGKANCYWRQANSRIFNKFLITNSETHQQLLTAPNMGPNLIEIKCNDSAGNTEKTNLSFNLEVDTGAPSIIRVYKAVNELKINTDENSLCYASTNKSLGCLFDLTNQTLMKGLEKEHSVDWKDDTTHYIICADLFGNREEGCSRIIRTY